MHKIWPALGATALATTLVMGGAGIALAVGGSGAPPHSAKLAGPPAPAALPQVIIPSPDEGVFTPIAPCRIVDTRVAGGAISTSGRSFYVAGAANFASQGGTSGGCAIPASANAIAVNLTATKESTSGYLTAYPAGGTKPTASVLNYQKVSIANALTLAIRPGTSTGLTVTASHSTQLVVDVTGYYAPQISAYVEASGLLYSQTSRVLSASLVNTGEYLITLDRNADSCTAAISTAETGYSAIGYTSGSSLYVYTTDIAGGVTTPADTGFNATVIC